MSVASAIAISDGWGTFLEEILALARLILSARVDALTSRVTTIGRAPPLRNSELHAEDPKACLQHLAIFPLIAIMGTSRRLT